jgi:hypothetical protein
VTIQSALPKRKPAKVGERCKVCGRPLYIDTVWRVDFMFDGRLLGSVYPRMRLTPHRYVPTTLVSPWHIRSKVLGEWKGGAYTADIWQQETIHYCLKGHVHFVAHPPRGLLQYIGDASV